MKTYEAVARAFVAEGVTSVFALMGDANLQWYAAMAELGVAIVPTRTETGAVAAAQGYADAGGGVGVCSVTCGPGLTQAGTALSSAARAGVPVVLFAGDTSPTALANPQDMDQRRFVEVCGATFVPLRTPESALDDVRLAFSRARTERRAVVLNAAMDLQSQDHPGERRYEPSRERSQANQVADPDEAEVDAVVDLIAASRRPVVLVGRGAMLAEARGPILGLANRIGALTATTMPAKGWLDEDEFAVGVVGPLSSAIADELFASADLVLGFGASLDRYTTVGRDPAFPAAELVSINLEGAARGSNTPADRYLVGDAGTTASRLLAGLARRDVSHDGYRTEEVRDKLGAAAAQPVYSGPGLLDPREVMQVLERHLSPDEHRVVIGCGHFFSWPIMHLRRPTDGRFLFTHHFGSIGLTVATGIGAAVAHPDDTIVVIEGDGSLMTSLPELETVARMGMRLLVIVLNDEAFGAEVYKAQTVGVDPRLAEIPMPRLDDVARSFGGDGAFVTDGTALEKALGEFEDRGGLYVIDARIDGKVICDMYRKLHFGMPNEAPHQRLSVGP